jgi:hypothetical protein
MPRYVILEHDHPVLHWDFMLEAGGRLRTWRLAALPGPNQTVAAEPIADHRLEYLDYEGPIRGNRGRVVRWDRGMFSWLEESPERIVVQMEGDRLQATAYLERRVTNEWILTLRARAEPICGSFTVHFPGR